MVSPRPITRRLATSLGVMPGGFCHRFAGRDDLLRDMPDCWEQDWTVGTREEA